MCLCGCAVVFVQQHKKKSMEEKSAVNSRRASSWELQHTIQPLALLSCRGKASGEGREYGTPSREAWHMGTSHQLPPSTLQS